MSASFTSIQRKKSIQQPILQPSAVKSYYTLRHYLYWIFGGQKFATLHPEVYLPNICFTHSTPLVRHLNSADRVLQLNKIINLKLAVKTLDHVVLYPGETLSFWKRIGKPTKQKGYRESLLLIGDSLVPGIGGGLGQLSNLIYWMTLHTPLTITERYRHNFDIFRDSNRTQPFGSGATCCYNDRDLVIRNDTDKPYELLLKVTDTELAGQWKSSLPPLYQYKIYEKDHHIKTENGGRYSRHNTLYRLKINRSGQVVADEYITENHAVMMYTPFAETDNYTT